MSEIEGVLVHRRLVSLYKRLKEHGFEIEPYLGLRTSREGWIAQNGVSCIMMDFPFETRLGIGEEAQYGDEPEIVICMHTNMGLMFEYFMIDVLTWNVKVETSRWVKIRYQSWDEAYSFCIFLKKRLSKYQDELTTRVVHFYLCLLHGTPLPKDIIRMCARIYYNNLHTEFVHNLNVLPPYVVYNPERL